MPVDRRTFLIGAASAATLPGLLGVGGDKPKPDPIPSGPFDICVIGSGFAGLPLAIQTARAGMKTVVVEAGFHPIKHPSSRSVFKFHASNSEPINYPVAFTRTIGSRKFKLRFRATSENGCYDNSLERTEAGATGSTPGSRIVPEL